MVLSVRDRVKVSVIIPVYNCEKFIEEFLDCLKQQTMVDYEAIFIDDCSSDRTSYLLKQKISKDNRFSYYHNKTRQGAACSRNRGIELSQAPYILCLDADDRFEIDLLEQVTTAAYENDADMVMLERGDFYGIDLNTIQRTRLMFEDEKQLYKRNVFNVKDQPIDFLLRCENGTCDRLIRKELLDKFHIRFQNLKNSNDVFYAVLSTLAAERIVHTNTYDNLYHRRIHSEEGRISNCRDPRCAFDALLAVHDQLIKYDLWDDYCVYFWIFALDSLEKQLFVCKNLEWQEEAYQYVQNKGLMQLGIEEDENYNQLPKVFQRQFDKFLKLPYSRKCFNESMTLEALCQWYSPKLANLVQKLFGKHLAFWGVGRLTAVFTRAYREQGGYIHFIIDNDVRKQGNVIEAIPVVSFDEAWNQTDAVIISNRHYYYSISEQILEKSHAIEILSLEEILFG